MKLLTLNTHSLQEENYGQKLEWFVETVLREKPDIIALQEVNQTCDAEILEPEMLEGQYPVPGCMRIRQDNHAAQAARRLRQAGLDCYWAWIPIKLGYDKYDEGVASLSSWRTRAVLGVQVEGLEDWFYTVHMGWWDDAAERFLDQWKRLNCCIMSKRMCGTVWLLGDFNAPDSVHGQSYEHIVASGWVDTFQIAHTADSGITVPGAIDGWRDQHGVDRASGMRLDYIWCSRKKEVRSSRVAFNGTREPVVSDHFGVMIEVKE